MPTGLDPSVRRTVPASPVSRLAAIDCPHGVAPGRMPRADATELAPKKSAQPSHVLKRAREGLSFSGHRKQKSLHFFGEAPERRPWAIKREGRARPLLPGASKWILRRRDTRLCLHRRSILSRRPIHAPRGPVTESEKSAEKSRENFEEKERGPLQVS